jgi:hypothetical protein
MHGIVLIMDEVHGFAELAIGQVTSLRCTAR